MASQESSLYTQLSTTARNFISSTSPSPPGSNTPNWALIRSLCHPSFQISFGPSLFASETPGLDSAKDLEGFIKHLENLCGGMRTWENRVKETVVDVERKTVVARIEFCMWPRDGGEEVRNDVVMFLRVETGEGGENGRVVEVVEYVDPVATGRIRERVMKLMAAEGA
ncbi:uncharacterized protein RHO25_008616 [Cercospora beticola]|uniref:SnoaL-like domain-containing protein n=1 Tax=Cercospora beticola TaxID=122368 RepID=A0ABZ0NWI8_CERBT|nr:hypothetical protein RHO25_008616 [Cercospora beticola]